MYVCMYVCINDYLKVITQKHVIQRHQNDNLFKIIMLFLITLSAYFFFIRQVSKNARLVCAMVKRKCTQRNKVASTCKGRLQKFLSIYYSETYAKILTVSFLALQVHKQLAEGRFKMGGRSGVGCFGKIFSFFKSNVLYHSKMLGSLWLLTFFTRQRSFRNMVALNCIWNESTAKDPFLCRTLRIYLGFVFFLILPNAWSITLYFAFLPLWNPFDTIFFI